MPIEVFFDGAMSPSKALGWGCLIIEGDKREEYWGGKPASDTNTNNVAEYLGVINALKFLKGFGKANEEIVIRGDSMLVVKQMQGRWGFKEGRYIPLAKEARKLAKKFSKLGFQWVPRDLNQHADRLSKLGIPH